jgi:hypothetical protein
MSQKIKMPKEITTLLEFYFWIRNKNIELRMKRRKSYSPDAFTQRGNKIYYLIPKMYYCRKPIRLSSLQCVLKSYGTCRFHMNEHQEILLSFVPK